MPGRHKWDIILEVRCPPLVSGRAARYQQKGVSCCLRCPFGSARGPSVAPLAGCLQQRTRRMAHDTRHSRGFRSACPSTMASNIWPKRLTASWRNPFRILRSSSATTRRRTVPPRSAGHMRSATPVFAITAMRRTSARYPISTGSSSFPARAFSSGQPTTICITRAI